MHHVQCCKANAYGTSKIKTKVTTNFCFCNTPSFWCYGKTKTKAWSFGHFKSSKPVIMPLTEWQPWPFLSTHIACVFSTPYCLWMSFFHSTAHKQLTRHIGGQIIAINLVFTERIHITCWLLIFYFYNAVSLFFFKICSPSTVYCYCWSVEGYYEFRELCKCRKGGQEGLQRRFVMISHCGEVPSNSKLVFVPKQSITKMTPHFCSALDFFVLNIFMMQKIYYYSANMLGIFQKQKQKL